MLYLLYTFATSEPNRRTCGGRRISWRCLGHQSESCRFLTTLPVGFCIQRGKPAGKLADDAGRWYRPYATTLPSSPHGAQTLPDMVTGVEGQDGQHAALRPLANLSAM